MKKLTTKQLAIALLAIAFAFIIGLTTYRGVTGQFKSTPTVSVQTKKTKKKKTASVQKEEKKEVTQETSASSQETQETNKQDSSVSTKKDSTQSTTPTQTDTNKKAAPSQTETKKSTTTTQTPPKQTQAPSQSTPVKQTVSVKVIGINETMMSGDIEVNSSSTAYSVLRTLAKQNNKVITTKGFGSTVYVSGIDGLKEFDHGPSSGWMYKVNGTPPNIGSGAYGVKAGDTVIWYYVNVEK